MGNSSGNRRKPRILDTKTEEGFFRRSYAAIRRSKSKLFKNPLFVLLFHIIVLYAVMIPVFYGCRPDRFLFGR